MVPKPYLSWYNTFLIKLLYKKNYMNIYIRQLCFIAFLFSLSHFNLYAQIALGLGGAPPPPADTAKPAPRTATKPYASVITSSFVSKWGLFGVHQDRDKIYFEIADSILNRDIMVINRLSKVPAGHGMYAGEAIDERTIYFEKGTDSTIRIRYKLVINEADSNSAIFKAVVNSSENPLVSSLPIITYGKGSSVVDVSKFLKERNFINSISPNTPLSQNVNAASLKNVNIESILTFPINVEIKISKTVESKSKLLPEGTPATLETNTSFIALPEKPMQRRYFDERVGYFADLFYEFGDEQQRAKMRRFIVRWRLEPKPEDMEKWKRGELVEPAKPIVIYIDPATPKQWRPYLIAGVNDWQKSFEKAGFKNAIIGKEWPENDTTMYMEDARFSFVRYLPSEIANAYGPNVHDPRSGEIIQTHIGWFHNVMQLLRLWYMTQASALDPAARKVQFDEKLMGELIRFVSSHEVGHTLGLRHNFGSSSRTPVDSLRSKSFLEKHGHTASIMDYARFNYVAQPEDKMEQKHLFPRIGDYDDWAIEWGYKFINATSADEDSRIVKSWIDKRIEDNPRLWFGDGETKRFDPQCQTEDLGDNAMVAGTYGIKNLKRILPNLPEWTYQADEMNDELGTMYKQVQGQYTRYLLHVLKNIGGVRHMYRSEQSGGPIYELVPKKMQIEAITFLDKELFKSPTWLMDKNVVNRLNLPEGPNFIEDIQARMVNSLLDIAFLNKLHATNMQFGKEALTLDEYMEYLHKAIWADLSGAGPLKSDAYQRNLQKAYFGSLMEIVLSKDPSQTENDATSIAKANLVKISGQIQRALPRVTDSMTKAHLQDLLDRFKTLSSPRI